MVLLMGAGGVAALGASQPTGVLVPPGAIVDSPNAGANPGVPNPPPGQAAPAAPATTDVLFYDDFSKGLDGWESLSSAAGRWVAADGVLQQRGDANGDVTTQEDNAVLLVKNSIATSIDNGVIEAAIYPLSGSPVGVVFRGSDAGYYRLSLYQGPPPVGGNNSNQSLGVLEKVTASGVQQIGAAPTTWGGYRLNEWIGVRVEAVGREIKVRVDNTQIMQVSDQNEGLSKGWAGVWTRADRGAHFDNVRILRAPGH